MLRRIPVGLAGLLVAVGGLASPAYAVTPAGLTCGIDLTQDPATGAYTGSVTGGPIRVAGATSVDVYCAFRFADGSASVRPLQCTTPGEVGRFCVSTVTIQYVPDDLLTVCTEVTWTGIPNGYAETCDLAAFVTPPGTYHVAQRQF